MESLAIADIIRALESVDFPVDEGSVLRAAYRDAVIAERGAE